MNDSIQATELDFDSLLDTSWDNIEDLPEFVTFPVGMYMFRGKDVKFMPADASKNKDAAVMLMAEMIQPMEISKDATPPQEGSLLGIYYSGKMGIQRMKKVFGELASSLGASNPKEFLDQFTGSEFGAAIKNRADKNDPDKVYNEVITVSPV